MSSGVQEARSSGGQGFQEFRRPRIGQGAFRWCPGVVQVVRRPGGGLQWTRSSGELIQIKGFSSVSSSSSRKKFGDKSSGRDGVKAKDKDDTKCFNCQRLNH